MEALWIIFLFLIGACVGSFLNVVIYRVPRGESIVFPPSHCPKCGRAIRWYDNIPLLSWLVLRGRCRFCKASISARYIFVEAVTALLIAGLYVCYFVLKIRQLDGKADGLGESWPTFIAYTVLTCGLLACSMVDIAHWIVPLEVCWVVSIVGAAVAAAAPHPWMPQVHPAAGAMSLAAAVGLILAIILVHYGLLQRSFVDACETHLRRAKSKDEDGKETDEEEAPDQPMVGFTSGHGVNPRVEILREVLFLAPAFVLAAAGYLAVTKIPAVAGVWKAATSQGRFAWHFNGFLAALFGYLIGGLWVWGMRIFGTLAFGKEAMGLGDVHLLAAVGAVAGWIVPSVAFFLAPFFGLAWALYLWLARNQRELPYGPWLAAAALVVMIFYDTFAALLRPYADVFSSLWAG